MTLTAHNSSIDSLKADLELIFVQNKNIATTPDEALLQMLGYEGAHATLQLLPEKARLYVGVEKNSVMEWQIVGAAVAKMLKSLKFQSLKAVAPLALQAFCEGLLLGRYTFESYKSKPKAKSPINILFAVENLTNATQSIERATIIAQSTNYTRTIVNTTPEEMYPLRLAKMASDLADELGLEVRIIDESQLLEMGMQAMYMVGRASVHASQLIHVAYKPASPKAKVTLIGKGLTYDSGGLSLKPADSMVTMKMDKSGGATVLGTLKAVASLKLPIEVHGFIGAVENMIGGNAYKPDDVLRAKNGVTIEVRNTDAEGRLVLADVLCYAQEQVKSDYIVDFATLTGACVVGLGLYTYGVMGHNKSLVDSVCESATQAGEMSAYLPFNEHLREELKSDIADIKNTASRWGGAITAGLFLDHFISDENKQKWAHLDIAGPAYTEKAWGVNPYGGTGAAVRTMVAWMGQLSQK
ncbi:MAG: aminopeptidase A [Sulfuricurvum sp. PC08-66]|nr:MAG: aminopeptidase A [Sulfuricurvum sp. PC08-66]